MHHLITLSETITETVSETVSQTTQAAAGGDSMDTMLSLLLLVMMLGCAVYCIYTFIRLRRECYLFPNKFLYPGRRNVRMWAVLSTISCPEF